MLINATKRLSFALAISFTFSNLAIATETEGEEARRLSARAAECTKDLNILLRRATSQPEKEGAALRLQALKASLTNGAARIDSIEGAGRGLNDTQLEQLSVCLANLQNL